MPSREPIKIVGAESGRVLATKEESDSHEQDHRFGEIHHVYNEGHGPELIAGTRMRSANRAPELLSARGRKQ